jgi:uncharacterized protein (TIGR02391 family)
MVSMSLDFYRYLEEVKKTLLAKLTLLDSEWDPFAASWLAYGLSQDGTEDNPPLSELIERLALWAKESEIWAARRNLGALCFLGYFLIKTGKEEPNFSAQVLELVGELLERQEGHKFSPLNDPEQVYPMALLVASIENYQNLKALLKETAHKRMRGPVKRQVLYGAARRELGEDIPLPVPTEAPNDPGDIIVLVWCWERYGAPGERTKWWMAFESIKDVLSFRDDEGREGLRILSVSEMALLYEALTRETTSPDPNLLFDLYPLHPRIREITASLFKNGEYQNAVEEATKALSAFIQEKTNSQKTEAELVQSVMKNLPKPTLRLVSHLGSDSGKNEQTGLALIAEGIFKAFRNPKAHAPKDAPHLQMDPLEALDQLVTISYIFKRVERAEAEV